MVIPAYKQPQYLKDALLSCIRQSCRKRIRTIVVDDGCPYRETGALGRVFSDRFAGEVFYLRKENGGLSSARNHGVRFALTAWPTLRAVFPLDADNRLSPGTLEQLWRRLDEADGSVGWAYQDLTFFGQAEGVWRTGVPFSLYRLMHENFCDAGSLIRREVFEAGVWWDESMRRGYEDWEFFIRAAAGGFLGIHVPDTDFLYRKHGHSMLSDAQSVHESISGHIRAAHPELYAPVNATEREHEELPRFALLEVDQDRVLEATDPCRKGRESGLAEFVGRCARWAAGAQPQVEYVPPMLVLGRSETVSLLRQLGLLTGLLFHCQQLLARTQLVEVGFERGHDPYVVEVQPGDSPSPALAIVRTRTLVDRVVDRPVSEAPSWPRDGLSRTGLVLRIGSAHDRRIGARPPRRTTAGAREALATLGRSLARELGPARSADGRPEAGERDPFVASHTDFAAGRHVESSRTTFPWIPNRAAAAKTVLFAVPMLGFGGVDQCVLQLAGNLRKSNPEFAVGLVVTESGRVQIPPRALSAFDSIAFLPRDDERASRTLIQILSAADVVVNAHSAAAYEALPRLRETASTKVISYLHVLDMDVDGRPGGFPLVAREYDGLIDRVAVISGHLRRLCLNLGVADDKLVVIPNAPTVAPRSRREGGRLAAAKATGRYSKRRPIRLLFAGRFDYQKGVDRLHVVVDRLASRRVPFHLELVGGSVLAGSRPPEPGPHVTIRPPAIERRAIARHYEAADVFLLPSRWEGLPLALLEAMAFANIAVAADVGAVSEVVRDTESGFLLDPALPDDALSDRVVEIVSRLAAGPDQFAGLREAAVEEAMGRSWRTSASQLAEVVSDLAESA